MPVSVRYRDGLLSCSQERGQSHQGSLSLQHIPLFPHNLQALPWLPTVQHNRVPTEMGPPVCPFPQGQWEQLRQSCFSSYSQNPCLWVKWECANDSHKAELHPLLRLWSVNSLTQFQHHTDVWRLQEHAHIHCPVSLKLHQSAFFFQNNFQKQDIFKFISYCIIL